MKNSGFVCVAVVAALAGCVSGDLSLSRDPGERDALFETMRRRMNVTVLPADPGQTVPEEGMTPDQFASFVRDVCREPEALGHVASACAGAISIATRLCVGHRLLEIIGDESERELRVTEGLNPRAYIVPAQSRVTEAALAYEAFKNAGYALESATTNLETPCQPLATTAWSDGTNSQTYGEFFASSYLEAFELAREALAEQETAVTAVADAQHSENGSIADATAMAMVNPYVSRASAAHSNLGGGEGLAGMGNEVAADGFCPVPRLSADGARALELLRLAAPNPAYILNTSIDIDELTVGGSTVPSNDGLARRLSYFAADAEVLREPGISAQDVYDFFGVSRGGFEEAREYMRQELLAFGRSRTMVAPAQPLPGGQTTDDLDIVIYASTRSAPRPPIPAYYAAMARYDADYQPLPAGTTGYPPFDSLDVINPDDPTNGARLVDAAITGLQRMLETGAIGDAGTKQILGEGLATIREQRRARVRACWRGAGGLSNENNIIEIDVHGVAASLAVVRGHEGLQCAVRGDVEGAPCALPAYVAQTNDAPGITPTGYTGFSDSRVLAIELDSLTTGKGASDDASTILFFIVEPREESNDTGAPGSYRPVAGFRLPVPPAGDFEYRYCEIAPVVPEMDDRVGRLITPSRDYCAISGQSCAGLPTDMRLPLENELTSDGDAIESSWRHYLNQAMNAANFADQLGEDLIRSGLDMDLRAEAAMDELQDLCGVAINLPSPTGIADLSQDGGECDCSTGSCGCPGLDEYTCQSGRCMLDPIKALAVHGGIADSDMERLAACIGDSALVEWATLGNLKLCLWESGGEYCAGETDDMPCPYFAGSDGTCNPDKMPSGASPIVVDRTLNIFPAPADEGEQRDPPDPTEYPCEILASWRNAFSGATLADLEGSSFLRPEVFGPLARRLKWEPLPGDFSRITWDDGTLFSTGSPYSETATDLWPCGAAPVPPDGIPGNLCPDVGETSQTSDDVAGHNGALFCLQGVCGADPMTGVVAQSGAGRAKRARMNDLLARAVIAARLLGGQSLSGLRVPYYPRAHSHTLDIGGELGWDLGRTRGAGPVVVQTSQLGQLLWDETGDPNHAPTPREFSDLAVFAQRIRDAAAGPVCPEGEHRVYPGAVPETLIPEGAEWTFCPYDNTSGECVEIFDDETDCDDAPDPEQDHGLWDRNLPFLVRTLPRAMDAAPEEALVREMWKESRDSDIPHQGIVWDVLRNPWVRTGRRAIPSSSVYFADSPMADLTGYWRRSWCGVYGGGACDAGPHGRHPDELAILTSRSDTCLTNTADGGACDTIGCGGGGHYLGCVAEAEARELDFYSTFDGNRAFIAPRGLTRRDLLNGLELLCVAGRQSSPDLNFGCEEAPPIESIADVERGATFMECKADAIRSSAAMMVMRDLPERVVEVMERGSGTVHGESSGEYGAAVSELRAAFIELRDTNEAIATTASNMATEMRAVRNAVSRSQINHQLEDLSLQSQVFERMTQCITALAKAAGGDTFGFPSVTENIAASATCANSTAQVYFASRMSDLRHQGLELDVEMAFINFERELNRHSAALGSQHTALQASLERIDAALARLETLQQRGRRALARALFLDSDATGRQFAASTVMRARHSTTLYRYREAHERAVRLAYIAKIALEQRLGMPLDSMRTDLVTVEAPSEWQGLICSLPSIDYDRIRAGDPELVKPERGYSDAYVGDYVRKLEQVFESYSFAYPFSDGTDTAVLSVRDDLHRVRATCDVEGPNLLFQAGHLDVRAGETRPGWFADGCASFAHWDPASTAVPPACVTVTPSGGDEPETIDQAPIGDSNADFGRVPGFRVAFGTAESALDPISGNPVTALTENTRYLQWVELAAGRYRLSWYARQKRGSGENAYLDPATIVSAIRAINLRTVDGELVWDEVSAEMPMSRGRGGPNDLGWERHHVFLDVPVDSSVAVVIDPGFTSGSVGYRDIDLTALMLENVTDSVTGTISSAAESNAHPPSPFFDTTDVRTRELAVCEDTYGDTFRSSAWTYGCVRVCADGYDGSCREGASRARCYYQTTFDVSSDWLQRRSIAATSGFASGNFNYRIESIGVNLVGTGLRDCSDLREGTSTGCYASGNVSYSILHNGPYLVRNARGELYSAPLFPGRIESARALAAERMLTNPLSSADRGLIEPYTRHEMRGRPLGGSFALRIWDDEGFRFDRLEDVQVVLGYRYWTRQQ